MKEGPTYVLFRKSTSYLLFKAKRLRKLAKNWIANINNLVNVLQACGNIISDLKNLFVKLNCILNEKSISFLI